MTRVSGGQVVVDVLASEQIERVFCVPGESYLGVLDALYDHPTIQLVTNRHEGGASFMAEAYAKATGGVGVCLATRAPGAANLAIGLHTAMQDSTPVVALIGQVEQPFAGREAFQEVDLAAWFSHVCKWTVEIRSVARIPELLHRAFLVAQSGRPGPVVVALPHDLSADIVEVADRAAFIGRPHPIPQPQPDRAVVAAMVERLRAAERPIVIAGGGVIRARASAHLQDFAARAGLPVVTGFRRFDAFPAAHPHYIGWLGLGTPRHVLAAVAAADVVLAIGTRLSQVTAQDYSAPPATADLLQVDIAADAFGVWAPPALAAVSDAGAFLAVAGEVWAAEDGRGGTDLAARRTERLRGLRSAYETWSAPQPRYRSDWVDLDGMLYDLNAFLPADILITSDAGNFFGWVGRYRRFGGTPSYIGPTSGAMGYGLPSAIAAKLAHPDRPVLTFAGDGGFLMTAAEMATAVQHGVALVAIVVNNGTYGTIRAHQAREYPGRPVATALRNPDFAAMARACGGHGERVTCNADLLPALQRAFAADTLAIVDVVTHPDRLSVSDPHPEG